MKILPNFNNQLLITIISDIIIAVIIVGSILTSQKIEQEISSNTQVNFQNQGTNENLRALQLNSLFRNFLYLNLIVIFTSSIVFIYLIIQNSRKLEEANLKLKELDKLKDEFISLASHQLKTPATGVKAFLSMLIEGDAGKLNAQQNEFASKSYEANERELRIVEDMLNVSRIESGRIQIDKKKLDIADLVSEVIDEQKEVINDKKQNLDFEKEKREVFVDGDSDKLKMVVGNLIDNASKYTKPGGKISVQIKVAESQVHISVEDSGVGISKEDQKKLFGKFVRIDNPLSNVVGGTGLGLYIAKKIVELHGGDVEVASELGKGTKFGVILPIRDN